MVIGGPAHVVQYAVLIAVPFKSLRFSTDSRQTWGVAFGRIVPRLNEFSFWPYITRRLASFGPQMARLTGLEGISPGRNLLVIPYGNFAADRILEPGGYVTERSARVGIDTKAVIKDTVTLDVTVNPDYSQVESDEPQVTINQRFEVFFPEKRPFFIENASYFETPVNLFFSRRVADPLIGGRVTGKAGGWAFGGLVMNDDAPGSLVPESDSRHEKTAAVAVLRVQREFSNQSHLGAIVTDREWGPTANRVFAADGRWRIDDNWAVEGQAVGSQTVPVEGSDRSGNVIAARLSREGRGFDFDGGISRPAPISRPTSDSSAGGTSGRSSPKPTTLGISRRATSRTSASASKAAPSGTSPANWRSGPSSPAARSSSTARPRSASVTGTSSSASRTPTSAVSRPWSMRRRSGSPGSA